MNTLLARLLVWTVSVVGVAMLISSCATTGGNWAPDRPEKGSAKGGASSLMQRH